MNKTNTTEKTKNIAICALFVALLAICSWISIPLAVPFTLQTFAVFLCTGLLGTKKSFISILCWILLGVVGVPVFAGFKAGPAVIIGPTGGYIIGFLLTALIVGIATEKIGRKPVVLAVSMIIGLIVCYLIGTFWFIFVYGQSTGAIGFTAVLSMCVFPFIIPDLVKMAIAIYLTGRLERFV